MKKVIMYPFLFGLLVFNFHFLTRYLIESPVSKTTEFSVTFSVNAPKQTLKEEALQVLKTKCNICHKKKNPFKIFNSKNMNRHAKKIHKQVFVYHRMPKGGEVKLTEEEYQTLKDWLNQLGIK